MKRSSERAIHELLIHRAPNWISEVTIRERLAEFSPEELDEALRMLVDANKVQQETDPQANIALPRRYFKLSSYELIPIRETIRVGNVEIPRILSSALVKYAPEDFNEAVELLAEHSESLGRQFEESVREQQKRYWANVVGLFGIFASVIALLVTSLPNLKLDTALPFWASVLSNLSVLLPVAVVLGLFVVFARWVIR